MRVPVSLLVRAGHIRLDKLDVVREIAFHGFRLMSNEDHVPGTQYLLRFTRSE
jgi:hypothetical protein